MLSVSLNKYSQWPSVAREEMDEKCCVGDDYKISVMMVKEYNRRVKRTFVQWQGRGSFPRFETLFVNNYYARQIVIASIQVLDGAVETRLESGWRRLTLTLTLTWGWGDETADDGHVLRCNTVQLTRHVYQ